MDKGDAYGMFKGITTKIKKVALNMSDIEIKVEEATNNEPWGPHGTAMADIAKAAYNWEQYRQIMGVVGRRLQSTGEDWRHVYKSLLLLDYLLKHGPTRIIQELDSSLSVIERFHNFKYVDASGKDCGINVRHRAKELSALIRDRERVEKERSKAKELKSKYGGMSREEASYGGGRSYSSSRQLEDYDAGLDRATQRDSGRMEGFGSDSYRGKRGGGSSEGGGYDPWPSHDDPPSRKGPTSSEDVGDDPVAATQRRIQDLKVKGLVDDDLDVDAHRPAPRPRVDVRAAPAPPARKRLSDMKVNPQIAATLAVPGGGALAAVPPPARIAAAPAPAPAAHGAGDDLLGGLGASTAHAVNHDEGHDNLLGQGEWNAFGDLACTTAAAPAPTAKASPAGDDVWDAFAAERAGPSDTAEHGVTGLLAAAASPTAGTNKDDAFDAFVGSSAGGTAAPAAAPLADLLGGEVVPVGAAAPPTMTTTAALDADLFSMGAPAAPAAGPSMIQMGVQLPVGLNVPMGAVANPPVTMAAGGFQGMVAVPGGVPGMMAVQVPPGWGVAGMPGQALPVGAIPTMGGLPLGGTVMAAAAPLTTLPSTGSATGPDSPMRPGHQRSASMSKAHDPFADIFK